MINVALRIAPQRNAQYQDLAAALARPEVELSPLAAVLDGLETFTVGDAAYLSLQLRDDPTAGERLARTLPLLAASGDAFGVTDTGWQPIAVTKAAFVPRLLTEARRYSGKTNELFTRVLVNIATFDHVERGTGTVRILDPMCGGGTTLFAALERGYSVVGADSDNAVVDGTAGYLRQFVKEQRIKSTEKRERAAGRGTDWHREITVDGVTVRCSLLQADLGSVGEAITTIPGGAKCHAIVGDLPYGIQHRGEVADMLAGILDVGRSTLTGNGRVAVAWNATKIDRHDLLDGLDLGGYEVRTGGPFDALGHRVDRVIKRRDVLVLDRRP